MVSMNVTDNDRRYTVAQVAHRYSVSRSTVLEWIQSGKLGAAGLTPFGPFFIDEQDISMAWWLREPQEPRPAKSTPSAAVYRHYDEKGALLYIGMSMNALARHCAHSGQSCWFERVTRIEIKRFETKEQAMEAERRAIETERPKYNIAHNGQTTG